MRTKCRGEGHQFTDRTAELALFGIVEHHLPCPSSCVTSHVPDLRSAGISPTDSFGQGHRADGAAPRGPRAQTAAPWSRSLPTRRPMLAALSRVLPRWRRRCFLVTPETLLRSIPTRPRQESRGRYRVGPALLASMSSSWFARPASSPTWRAWSALIGSTSQPASMRARLAWRGPPLQASARTGAGTTGTTSSAMKPMCNAHMRRSFRSPAMAARESYRPAGPQVLGE